VTDIDRKDEELRAALRRAIPPATEMELARDLWPEMQRRLTAGDAGFPWLDWGLAAAALLWLLLFPKILLPLLYHL